MVSRPATLRRAVRWAVPAVLVLAVVAWFAVRAVTASGAESDRYATATVSRGAVTETYAGSGTVTKTDQSGVSFPVAAKVTAVDVAVGDKVSAGDPLASIDNTALKLAVIQAKQTVTEAEVTLQNAQDAADAAASASASPSASASASATSAPSATAPAPARATSTAPSAPKTTASSRPSPTGGGSSTTSPGHGGAPQQTLAQLTAALRTAQDRLNELTRASAQALTEQTIVCAPLAVTLPGPGPTTATPSGTTTPTATLTPSATVSASPSDSPSSTSGSPTPSATDTGSPTPSGRPTISLPVPSTSPVASVAPAVLARCIAAVVGVQHAQQAVAGQQGLVDQAVAAVAAKAASSGGGQNGGGQNGGGQTGGGSENSGGQSGGQTSGGQHSGSTSQTGTSSGTSRTSGSQASTGTGGQGGQTATTVASAEAAVTKADLALTTAETRLKAATLRAPISGTVAALPFTKGEQAATSDQAVIIAKGAVEVVMAVPEASFRTLQVGQPATITTAGGGRATGKVSRLALLPTDSTSGSTTFGATVAATGKPATALAAGADASVAVTLAASPDALVVPVSAVTRTGSTGVVQVLVNGVVTRTDVTLGAVGTTTVEVTHGLTAGQTVVLADNTTALPTNSSNRGLRTGGAGGGIGGTGGPPAGAGGAPPGGR